VRDGLAARRRRRLGLDAPTLVTAMPEAKSMKELPSASTRTPPSASTT
jgi:hypothetical protein